MDETPFFWERHYSKCGNIWAGGIKDMPCLPEGSFVLEAGCGNGKTICALKGEKLKVFAFDFSQTASKLCKKNLPLNSDAEIFVSDASHLPFSDNMFDCIFARHITGHSGENKRKEIAEEFERVLKKGGRLYFSEFEVSDMRFGGGGEETERNSFIKKNGIMTHFFSEDETMDLFSNLKPLFVKTERWSMYIRGKENIRSEINAVFEKQP